MNSNDDGNELTWTGERYVPEVGGNIRLEHLHRYFVARELCRGKRVLDIACGEGYGANLLAAVATQAFGVDIASDVVAHAALKYRRSNLEFKQGSCEAIPLPDHCIDVVVSFETLEHISGHDRMLREIRRVLRPQGLLLISSPDRDQYSGTLGNRNPFHARELSRQEFEQLLRAHFREIAISGQRIVAGSVMGPAEVSGPTTFISFAHDEEHQAGVIGLRDPVFLLAIASDGPLPSFPVGLLAGPDFAWASDLSRFVDDAVANCAEDLARRLGEPVEIDRSNTESVRRAYIFQADRLSETVRALARTREAARETTLKLAETSATLASVQADLFSSWAMAKSHTATEQWLEQKARRLADERMDLRRRLEKATSLKRSWLAQRELIAYLEAKVAEYEGSRSWRLTAPLRALRRFGPANAMSRPEIPEDLSDFAGEWESDPRDVSPRPAAAARRRGVEDDGWGVDEHEGSATPVPIRDESAPVDTRMKLIAFYLPQFHPIPENDEWWGKGFTEWRFVTRATPQFHGHYQPHLPGELGFYDLRVPDVQERQIELAKLYGLHGFCYYHYWFHGKRLLRRPMDQLLSHPEWDFPFCLCWANENWTRRWDGRDEEWLIAQAHSPEDDLAFIRDIEPALRDPRYIRIGGRPLLLMYRPALLPDPQATAKRWRIYCEQVGIGDLFLMATHAFDSLNPRDLGFDAALEFVPNNTGIRETESPPTGINPQFRGRLYDYRELVEITAKRDAPAGYPLFRSVTPMWDNEARRPSNGSILINSSPQLYEQWLERTCQWTERHVGIDKPFVFVNAWNEWAEGAHLEPDQRHGYTYLQATANALARFPKAKRPPIVLVSHDAHLHGAQLIALSVVRALVERLHYDVEIILAGGGQLEPEFAALGRVHDFASPHLSSESKRRILQQLYDDGARIALCNTSVVGDTVELLKEVGFSTVSLVHELPGLIRERSLEGSAALIARHADRVVFPSEHVRDRFIEVTGPLDDRSVVQPQGLYAPNPFFDRREIAANELRKQLGVPTQTPIILAVGFADRRKGVDLFVDVGLRTVRNLPDAVFVWVGHHDADTFAQVRARIDAAGLSDRFRFPGTARNASLFFAGADAYLMTSREDPFPSVVLEALDAGLPVIAFDGAGGFLELVRKCGGIIVPFTDTAAMAAALTRLLTADDGYVGDRAREMLSRDFSPVNYARTLVELVGEKQPTISAIVPNFNYARYLETRLDSIVNQTYPPNEVIFLDDASTDDSVPIARRLLHRSGLSHRLIVNDANRGVYRQWIRGIQEARGDLIWIAEADDFCSKDLLAQLIPYFRDPQVNLAYCQSRQVDEDDNEIAPDYLAYTADVSDHKWLAEYVRPGVDELRDSLAIKNTIPNVSAVLMRRPDLSQIEHDLATFKNAGDYLLYLHILAKGSIAFTPDVLNSHRRHTSSMTIGNGGLNLMREILLVQDTLCTRYEIAEDVAMKREAERERIYRYLRLESPEVPSYKDHQALWPTGEIA